jgi:hypothetical protein
VVHCLSFRTLPLALVLTLPLACVAEQLPGPDGTGGNGAGGATGSGASPGTGSTPGVGGTIVVVDGQELSVLPARIRRLTNAEYNASVQSLLGTTEAPAADFPPDTRQHGYTVNEAQRVDPVLARALDGSALALAAAARTQFDTLAPCADPTGGAEACAQTFIESFAQEAYRRPLDDDDRASLLALYRAGAEGATYADGIELTIRGILQSPGFLYLTEIGGGGTDKVVTLTAHELAAELSYTVTGGPPDEALLEAAAAGALATPEGREAEVRRLFTTEAGKARAVQVVREWLGIDRISSTAKDATIYPNFAAARDSMAKETADFVGEVLSTTPGTVSDLLGSTWSVIDPTMASLYDVSGSGRVEMTDRVGLLNQGAFLSVYGHAHETAPVLRGVAVLRRLTCIDVELPTTLNVQIIPPVPDPNKTTRERFEIHALDGVCANCHNSIDPLGFAFEQFDSMGAFREFERPKDGSEIPVDSSVVVSLQLDFDGPYDSSNELAAAMAESAAVRDCFARQIFRSAAGEGQGSEAYEESFQLLWDTLPADQQGALLDILVTYAKSPLFTLRGAP